MHVLYCADELEKGSSWGESGDDYLLRKAPLKKFAGRKRVPADSKPALVSYEALTEDQRESRRAEVRDIPKELAADGYIMRPVPSAGPLDELLELRCTLEAAAAKLAADGGDPAQLELARAALVTMQRKDTPPEEFHDADVSFHLALTAASKSEAMHLMMLGVRDAIAAHVREIPAGEGDSQATLRRRAQEHGEILRAVEDHEGERAGELIRKHLTGAYQQRLQAAS